MERIILTRNERIQLEKEKRAYTQKRKFQRVAIAGTAATGIMLSVYSNNALACQCNDIYTVQKGDTLYALAKKYSVSVEQLQNANGLPSNLIYAGQKLEVPFKETPSSQPQPKVPEKTGSAPQTGTYIVQRGDSLSLLANKYGTSVENIKQVNGLQSDLIRVGQSLAIPGAKAAPPVKEPAKPVPAPSGTHIVQRGDSLSLLANKYGTSVDKIKQANGLQSDLIRVGQSLAIPGAKAAPPVKEPAKTAPEAQAGMHVVQHGDSLSKLANKYGTSVDKIKQANGLQSDLIRVGQSLAIPGAKAAPPVKEPAKTAPEAQAGTHVVQRGDSLSKLANKYGTSVDKIKQANGLQSDLIRVGQSLAIPGAKTTAPVKEPAKTDSEQAAASIYQVAAGDTLWGIAQRFHVSVSDIKLQNNMNSDMVVIGQKLVIKSNSLVKTTATVVGAADNFTVEFKTDKGTLVLQVAYGTGQDYSNLSGKKVEVVYSNGERPALVSYKLI